MFHIVTGSDDFSEFIQPNNLFVDKSLFIQEIIDNKDKVLIITRPRRWGKTLNLSMLNYFLAEKVRDIVTKGMFDNLKIAAIENGKYIREYQGKYPVVFISFKDVNGANYAEAYQDIRLIISNLFISYEEKVFNSLNDAEKEKYKKYVNESCTEAELKQSLGFLTQCLYANYQQKAYILIDEYDRPLNTAFGQDHSFKELSKFMGALFGACLKTNPYLEKGIVSGIFRIAKAGIFSELNNARECTLLDELFAKYYGFTEAEVNYLCENFNVTEPMRSELRKWYNGYNIGGLTIYNPWSIMMSLSAGELDPYWIDTSNNVLIKSEIRKKYEIQSKIDSLLAGESITVEIDKHLTYEQINFHDPLDPTIWTLFLNTGYLTIASLAPIVETGLYLCNLRIPNLELKSLYLRDLRLWLHQTARVKFPEFLDCLLKQDIAGFTNGVNEYLEAVFNVKDLAKDRLEAFYHAFVAMMVAGLWEIYHIESNRTAGDGFPDLIFIPRKESEKTGMIMEFKRLDKDATNKQLERATKEALKQIDIKNYATIIKDHQNITEIFKIGMVFSGKRVFALANTQNATSNK